MDIIQRFREWLIPLHFRWLIEDIDYFIDKNKYPSKSPLQENVKSAIWYLQSSMIMGAVGTVGLCISVRRNAYGAFKYFSPKRALF